MGSTTKGRRVVEVGTLSLKWTWTAAENFEVAARKYLTDQGALKEGQLIGAFDIANRFIDADMKLRIMALEAATGLKRDEIIAKIEEEDLTKLEINKAIMESLALAESPSLVASLKANWQRSEELAAIKAKAEETHDLDQARKDLEALARRLGVLDSPILKSGSVPTKPKT